LLKADSFPERANEVNTLINDIKYAFRQLRKSPGFTVLVVLTLGLGIGANTVIFSFLDRVLLRPLPVKKSRELVKVEYQYQPGGDTDDCFNYPLYVSYRDQSQVFSGLTAYTLYGKMSDLSDLRAGDSVEQVPQMSVSNNYFSVLGIRPVIGRTFLPEEEKGHGTNPVALISHRLWRRLFACDPAALGKTIRLNNHTLTVIGVTPPEFTGTVAGINPAVYVPLGTLAQMSDYSLDNRGHCWLHLLGRLKPGVSREQAQARLRVLAGQIHRVEPMNTYTHILISDGSRGTNPWSHEEGWWLFITLFQTPTLLILLVACANVANMLLARGMMRQKEIAIRRAIGASRGAIVRQLLLESSLLALLSGVCGALLAYWLTVMLYTILPAIRHVPAVVDGRILLLTLLGSLGSVFVFGLAPALQVSRPNVMSVLKDGAGAVTLFARRYSLRNFLVVVQVAFSVIVLSFGVLCLLSLRALRVADPGFDAKRVLAVSVNLKRGSPVNVDVRQLFTSLQERVTSLPGVQAVSLASGVPLSGGGRNRTNAVHVDNFQFPADGTQPQWAFTMVGPGYFQTLGVPLLRGRDFSLQDGPGAPAVMIVNELMAQRFWPGQDPIGKCVTLGMGGTREVVGVVKAVKFLTIRDKPAPLSFWPLAQQPNRRDGSPLSPDSKWVLLIRSQGDRQSLVSLLQGELESVGLTSATYNVSTLAERASELLNIQRAITGLLSVIGSVGLLFVATGIAGVVAYEVSQRTREIGIRMALGAQWKDVLQLVLRKGAILTGIGLAFGTGLSSVPLWILSRLSPEFRFVDETILYGVHMWDPLTYICVVLLVSLIMLAACWFPARRAAKIDPMVALRYE
jgi:predicted permease